MVVSIVNLILSSLTLITGALVILVPLAYLIIIRKHKKTRLQFKELTHKYGAPIIFLIAVTATIGSLFFSELANYNVCNLCWYQRIMMYPLVLISGIMLIRKTKEYLFIIIPMSIIGSAIALYHYLIQVIPNNTSCGIDGVSCVMKPFLTFGYISIPMMALTAFLAILLVSTYMKRTDKKTNKKHSKK